MILGDVSVIRAWEVQEDGSDYERACELLELNSEGGPIEVGSGTAMLWELFGGGIADIWLTKHGILLVRSWLEDATDDAAAAELAALPPNSPQDMGDIRVDSGTLAILWAPESGLACQSISLPPGLAEEPSGDLSMGGTGLLLGVSQGTYSCFHDEVTSARGQARRCHLIDASSFRPHFTEVEAD